MHNDPRNHVASDDWRIAAAHGMPDASLPSLNAMDTPSTPESPRPEPRALRILAKSVYRELKAAGYGRPDIVRFTNELLELVTEEIREPRDAS